MAQQQLRPLPPVLGYIYDNVDPPHRVGRWTYGSDNLTHRSRGYLPLFVQDREPGPYRRENRRTEEPGEYSTEVEERSQKSEVRRPPFAGTTARDGSCESIAVVKPVPHSERDALVRREDKVVDGKLRKYYRLTARGRAYLKDQKRRLMELVGEAFTADELRALLEKQKSRMEPKGEPV